MNFNLYSKIKILIILIVIVLFEFDIELWSQAAKDNVIIPKTLEGTSSELDDVKFEGNKTLSSDELKSIITSLPTEKSLPHEIISYYAYNAYRNRATPKYIKAAFINVIKKLSYEIRYFNTKKADEDTTRIITYYNQYGFHNANASYKFIRDKKKRKNTLVFNISENARWNIRSLNYIGLKNVDPNVTILVNKERKLRKGDQFNEFNITNEVSNINRVLVDNGYYFSRFDVPVISIDTTDITDSVAVVFHTGNRQKISDIKFIDSTRGMNIVSYPMKEKQLDINVGDWYSASKVQSSENNLRSLGTFDMVKIDTSSEFASPTATSLPFVVYLQYRKEHEIGIAPFFGQNAYDRSWDAGIETSYTDRNFLTGAALTFNPFVNFTLLDLGKWFSSHPIREQEYQVGINMMQPLLTIIGAARIGGSAQLSYAYRTISNFLRLHTVSLPFRFPIKLPGGIFFNRDEINLTLERQWPVNFSDARQNALQNAKTAFDTLDVLQALMLYRNMDKYINQSTRFHLLTALILGGNIISDTRDNPFSPFRGHYISFSAEGGPPYFGIAEYVKVQGTYYQFWKTAPQLVLAWKAARLGYIHWYNRYESYVPFERQFFAGGANSVRGWPSRQLRYINEANFHLANINFLKDFVGSGVIVEGSFEARFRLATPKFDQTGNNVGGFWSNFGIVPFLDYGNTFQWFVVDTTTGNYFEHYKISDYFNPAKWGWAIGIGVRYETPVGPFRVDFGWPLYDPLRGNDKLLFKRQNELSTVVFHIALGHAF